MKEDKFLKLFHAGNTIDAYTYFGAHKEKRGFSFTVYAPHARKIFLIGSFTGWNDRPILMERTYYQGVWKAYSEKAIYGDTYKYRIEDARGNIIEKSDPYAFQAEYDGEHASIVADVDHLSWHDEDWMANRDRNEKKPLNIYEVYAGGWKKDALNACTYRYLTKHLLPYVKEKGYTHIELMPLNEHPYDGSWGYQASGYFALTRRYGSIQDFKEFVEACHREGIGVIMDMVLSHFVKDDFGLKMFDGSPLYEYPQIYDANSLWGTLHFHLGKPEVVSFLLSSCAFWCDKFHIDGLRIDAVSHMIYRHGNKSEGVSEEGIRFLKRLNYRIHERFDSVMMVAEDSSDCNGVTRRIEEGGLGFDYKWDLGWMNDTLHYFQKDPTERSLLHGKIAFSMAYYYSERFLLPLSHDENVHGKKTILDQMWGSYANKFAQARVLYGYMYTHPGKKLNFMGNEIGMFREFDEMKELDWELLKYPMHQSFQTYMQDLNKLYLSHPCLYKNDEDSKSFQYLKEGEEGFAYVRKYEEDEVLFLMNTTDKPICMTLSTFESYKIELDSQSKKYGGTKKTDDPIVYTDAKMQVTMDGFECMILTKQKEGRYVH